MSIVQQMQTTIDTTDLGYESHCCINENETHHNAEIESIVTKANNLTHTILKHLI